MNLGTLHLSGIGPAIIYGQFWSEFVSLEGKTRCRLIIIFFFRKGQQSVRPPTGSIVYLLQLIIPIQWCVAIRQPRTQNCSLCTLIVRYRANASLCIISYKVTVGFFSIGKNGIDCHSVAFRWMRRDEFHKKVSLMFDYCVFCLLSRQRYRSILAKIEQIMMNDYRGSALPIPANRKFAM